jgi:hypothetical protein
MLGAFIENSRFYDGRTACSSLARPQAFRKMPISPIQLNFPYPAESGS